MATHIPVMAKRVAKEVLGNQYRLIIDCTFGLGGHAEELNDTADYPIEIYGIERDPKTIEFALDRFKSNKNTHIRQGNFADLDEHARQWGIVEADAVFADLGQSSLQLDDPRRGFAFRLDGPLDLRYDQTSGETASDVLNQMSRDELADMFFTLGEEKRSRRIASEVVKSRPVERTSQLVKIVSRICPGRYLEKSLARIFLSLRNFVNNDLDSIERMLTCAVPLLKKGGRIIVISFDSLQDRIVKNFFREQSQSCICSPDAPVCVCNVKPKLKILTKKPVIPEADELAVNPRCRSAKMRCALKL